jgi:hypothetical protein
VSIQFLYKLSVNLNYNTSTGRDYSWVSFMRGAEFTKTVPVKSTVLEECILQNFFGDLLNPSTSWKWWPEQSNIQMTYVIKACLPIVSNVSTCRILETIRISSHDRFRPCLRVSLDGFIQIHHQHSFNTISLLFYKDWLQFHCHFLMINWIKPSDGILKQGRNRSWLLILI